MDSEKFIDRAEVVHRLRHYGDLPNGNIFDKLVYIIGLGPRNGYDAPVMLTDFTNRLADLIESAPVEPSEDARELSKELRDNLERDASRSILLTSNPPKRPFAPYVAVENYLDFADRIERIAAPVKQNEDARELADAVRELKAMSCRRRALALGTSCGEHEHCADCRDRRIDLLADKIERIAAPDMSRYVELPTDKDGEPIRIGDTIYSKDGEEWQVTSLRLGEDYNVACKWVSGKRRLCNRTVKSKWMTHAKPRTLEDVIADVDLMTEEESEPTREQFREFVREAHEIGKKRR